LEFAGTFFFTSAVVVIPLSVLCRWAGASVRRTATQYPNPGSLDWAPSTPDAFRPDSGALRGDASELAWAGWERENCAFDLPVPTNDTLSENCGFVKPDSIKLLKTKDLFSSVGGK
jgi:hypothetical protein